MSGRFDGRDMDADYNPPGFNSYERSCESNVVGGDHKDSPPQYTLQGVVHFLQTEWARIETQRSTWEADRSEMRARIAFLEGERRGQENLKQDLVRRIKMLEYALKQERVKFYQYKASVSGGTTQGASDTGPSVAPVGLDESKPPICEPLEKLNQCTKQAVESNAKYIESRTRLKKFLQEIGCTDALLDVRQTRVLQLLRSTPEWQNAISNLPDGKKPKPQIPNAMRQDEDIDCSDPLLLSAIAQMDNVIQTDYGVTSSGPVRPVDGADPRGKHDSIEPDTTAHSQIDADQFDSYDGIPGSRFRRSGGPIFGEPSKQRIQVARTGDGSSTDATSVTSVVSSFLNNMATNRRADDSVDETIMGFDDQLGETTSYQTTSGDPMANAGSSQGADIPWNEEQFVPVRYIEKSEVKKSDIPSDVSKLAVPDSGLELGDLAGLTVANEMEPTIEGGLMDVPRLQDPNADENNEADVPSKVIAEPWTVRFTLRGHFDGVRSVAFHSTQRVVFTAGEDGCVMLWDLEKRNFPGSVGLSKHMSRGSVSHAMDDLEPVHVYCGHTGPVLRVASTPAALAHTTLVKAYSAGLDGTVRAWCFPSSDISSLAIDLFAPRDKQRTVGSVFRGSTSAVWDIAMHPSLPLLVAAHADCAIELWSTNTPSETSLQQTIQLDTLFKPPAGAHGPIGRPTCLQYLPSDSGLSHQCLVGTSTGWLFLLDINTGQIVSHSEPAPQSTGDAPIDPGSSGTWNSQALNVLAAHHTLSFVLGAHDDGVVRFYDVNRMAPKSSVVGAIHLIDKMVAHMDSITSLAIEPHGLHMLTGSHDASIRLWDIENHRCLQELTEHRSKYNEAVHSVAMHPQFPLAASAGADGICRIYDLAGFLPDAND